MARLRRADVGMTEESAPSERRERVSSVSMVR